MTIKYRLFELIFNQPLAIVPAKLATILSVIGDAKSIDIQTDLQATEMPELNAARSSESYYLAGSGIGILPISGSLVNRTSGLNAYSGLISYQNLSADIDGMLKDDAIEHIVLDIDSGGGSVNGLFDLVDKIYSARGVKPITAIVNEAAYSAAYAIASAADQIILTRTGGVGSIGVIAQHVDQSAYNEKAGIKVTSIYAGDRKADLSPHEPLSDEAFDEVYSEVYRIYDLFVETVSRNRGIDADSVRNTQAGLYRGQKAVEMKLADQIMSVEAALKSIQQQINDNRNNKSPRRSVLRRAAAISIKTK